MSIETVVPQPRAITIGGRTLQLTEIRARDLPGFASTWAALVPIVTAIVRVGAPDVRANPFLALEFVVTEAEGGMEALLKLATIGAKVEAAWVGDLSLDQFIELVAAVYEVNTGFFTRRLLPLLEGKWPGLKVFATELGQKFSPASSDTGTSEIASSTTHSPKSASTSTSASGSTSKRRASASPSPGSPA